MWGHTMKVWEFMWGIWENLFESLVLQYSMLLTSYYICPECFIWIFILKPTVLGKDILFCPLKKSYLGTHFRLSTSNRFFKNYMPGDLLIFEAGNLDFFIYLLCSSIPEKACYHVSQVLTLKSHWLEYGHHHICNWNYVEHTFLFAAFSFQLGLQKHINLIQNSVDDFWVQRKD